MIKDTGFTGIAYPFQFSSKGGVLTSSTSSDDFSHIEEEIFRLLQTYIGEVAYDDDGSNLIKLVFSNDEELAVPLANSYTREALAVMQDRISIEDVTISYEENEDKSNTMYIDVTVLVKKYQRTTTISVPINNISQ